LTNLLATPNSVDYAGGTVIHLTWPVLTIVAVAIVAFLTYRKWKKKQIR
jgi:ammonia channel protein AmtB